MSGSHDGRPHDKRDTEEPEPRCGVSGDPLVKVVECGLDVLQHGFFLSGGERVSPSVLVLVVLTRATVVATD